MAPANSPVTEPNVGLWPSCHAQPSCSALGSEVFLPRQDLSAYRAPRALVGLPRQSELYFKKPFGPIDSTLLADRGEELVGEINVSNGALVAAIARNDPQWAARTAKELRAFEVGIN